MEELFLRSCTPQVSCCLNASLRFWLKPSRAHLEILAKPFRERNRPQSDPGRRLLSVAGLRFWRSEPSNLSTPNLPPFRVPRHQSIGESRPNRSRDVAGRHCPSTNWKGIGANRELCIRLHVRAGLSDHSVNYGEVADRSGYLNHPNSSQGSLIGPQRAPMRNWISHGSRERIQGMIHQIPAWQNKVQLG